MKDLIKDSLNWAVGVFFILSALPFFGMGLLVPLPLILIALMFLPPVRKYAFEKTGKTLSLKKKLIYSVILFVVFSVTLDVPSSSNLSGDRILDEQAVAENQELLMRVNGCSEGQAAISGLFYPVDDKIPFKTEPSNDAPPVINEKFSKISGQPQSRELWTGMVLTGLCETDGWIKAKISSSDGSSVDWESGWVEAKYVTGEMSEDQKAGLIWNIDGESDFTADEKKLVRQGALKVLNDEPKCEEITYGYRSGSKQGAYYVTCNDKNDLPFNVWFTPEEVASGSSLKVPDVYPETQSRAACEHAIRRNVNHPSTLEIHSIMGYATQAHNNGNRTIMQDFSAQNSFGLELKYQARCLILPSGEVEITIQEKG